jgi:hypothetical protein
MRAETIQRPKWEIDHILDGLLGQNVRVAAKAFSPPPSDGCRNPRFRPVRDLFLPDNSRPAGLPVYFEGRLLDFERQVGVVRVRLDSPASSNGCGDGTILFRGQIATIVRGPAVVELAFPLHIESLPMDEVNYWRDLRLAQAQFEFPFAAAEHKPEGTTANKKG